MNRFHALTRSTIACLLFLACPHVWASDFFAGLDVQHPIVVDGARREIRILADMQPSAFVGGWLTKTPGHHAVVWKGGKKSSEALLAAHVDDAAVYDALLSLGAKPGNNLTPAAWEERTNPASGAPDTRVEGSPVDAFVWWLGLAEPLPLSALFVDPGTKGVELRFGGHKDLIPVWRSGCIVCLQSCPGGKISNREYTMRDYAQGKATFTLNTKAVPEGTRRAVVIIRLTRE